MVAKLSSVMTILAALLATFNTNPITTPFFAMLAMSLGHWILGIEKPLTAEYIGAAFANAGTDLWFGFHELARRHGDYAIVGLAASARRQDAALTQVRIALMGVDAMPMRARKTEALLAGKVPDAATIALAVASLRAEIDPLPDLTNNPETKRHLAGVLLQRVLAGTHG